MFRGVFWKIWKLGVLCSILAICLAFLVLVNYYLNTEAIEMVQRNRLLAQVITHEAESGYLKGIWPYKTLKMISDAEDILLLWVVKPNGQIFWANEPEMIGRIIQDPFLGSEEEKIRNSSFQGEKIKLIGQPLNIELIEKPWTLLLGVSFQQLRDAQWEIILLSMASLVLIVIVISFVVFYFSRRITAPLKTLIKDLGILGKEDFSHRVKIKTGDEIEEVGRAINVMAEEREVACHGLQESKETLAMKVRVRTRELQDLAASLEMKVKERTKELQRRVDELEEFHRLTVGRELKMIELKKEIERLKGKTSEGAGQGPIDVVSSGRGNVNTTPKLGLRKKRSKGVKKLQIDKGRRLNWKTPEI